MEQINFNIQTSSFNIFKPNLIKIMGIFNPLGLQLITRHSVHWGINPLKNTTPLFLVKAPLNRQTVQATPF